MKKLSQFLKSHISGTLEAISLKFGMWSTEVGGSVHSKSCRSSRQHRATELQKLHFLSSCQYTHGCCAPASWAARHTTLCLDIGLCETSIVNTGNNIRIMTRCCCAKSSNIHATTRAYKKFNCGLIQ